jgi:hypothetical protein
MTREEVLIQCVTDLVVALQTFLRHSKINRAQLELAAKGALERVRDRLGETSAGLKETKQGSENPE